ncbi:MAG: RNA methyltransferase [candidate division Zixibacteria bacterium]|nr:RNA methyltransferase [candidate division Zixibacteria bacterium]
MVQSALESGWQIEKIVIKHEKQALIEKLNLPAELIALCQSSKFDKIAPSQSPQGILAIIKAEPASVDMVKLIKKARRIIACDNVSDPGNLGTIIRTAAAFNYDLVICLNDCAELYNSKTVRATQGGLFKIPIIEISSAGEFLKLFAGQFNIVTFSGSAKKPMAKAGRIKRPVLVVGGETAGINPQIEKKADFRFRIEQSDNVESLNVAVAAGLAMYKFHRGFGK